MSSTQVRLGEHHFETTEGYEQDIDIAAVYTHASYGLAVSHDRDIAVIKLASPAKFNSHVGPVCLQSSNADFPPGKYVVQPQPPPIISYIALVMKGKAISETLRDAVLLQRKHPLETTYCKGFSADLRCSSTVTYYPPFLLKIRSTVSWYPGSRLQVFKSKMADTFAETLVHAKISLMFTGRRRLSSRSLLINN